MKGLHKDSVQNVGNPHQWMIDDARMELIQQIKAEVERLKKDVDNTPLATEQIAGYLFALVDVQKSLSALQERLEKLTEHKDIDIEIGHWMDHLDDKYCTLVNHYSIQDIKDTARHFYELGRQSKKEDVIIQKARTEKQRVLVTETDGNANVFWDTRSLDDVKALLLCGLDFIKKQNKEQPVYEGLEEEAEHFCEDMWDDLPPLNIPEGKKVISVVYKCARHFAQWGAEHLKK